MPYSDRGDLLIGDVVLGPSTDPDKFVSQAADDINAKLGWIYQLPLRPKTFEGTVDEDSWKNLPVNQVLTLKGINNKLASGRLIMAINQAGEGNAVHAYGSRLVKEANDELLLFANASLDLDAALLREDDGKILDRVPGYFNPDDESLLDGFEKTVMGAGTTRWYSRPGKVP